MQVSLYQVAAVGGVPLPTTELVSGVIAFYPEVGEYTTVFAVVGSKPLPDRGFFAEDEHHAIEMTDASGKLFGVGFITDDVLVIGSAGPAQIIAVSNGVAGAGEE